MLYFTHHAYTHTHCAHCAAGVYGGAVITKGTAHVTIDSSTLSYNKANFGGGIVLFDHSSGMLLVPRVLVVTTSSDRHHITK